MKHTVRRLFSIGKIMLMKNTGGIKMVPDILLLPIYILEPLFHTLLWILINFALGEHLQPISGFKEVFLIYLGLTQWFCLRKILSGASYDLHVYHALECMSFFNFIDLVLAKTLSYFIFYEIYVFIFMSLIVLYLKIPVYFLDFWIIILSTLLWFIQLFLMKFIILLIDSLAPIVTSEIERGLDRLFYFGSSLFYSEALLSEKAQWLMSYNPLYQYTTILKSQMGHPQDIMLPLFIKQCIICAITCSIFGGLTVLNRCSIKKVRANQAFHLTMPY